MAEGRLGRSVLSGHLALMGAFDFNRPCLSLAELSRRTGLAPSTTFRLVSQLTAEGLLERQDDRTYRLGVRLWELACRTPGASGLRELAREALELAHHRIGEHVQFGILHDSRALILERLSAADAVPNGTLVGGRLPANASSIGLVLLAHSPADVVDRVLADPLDKYTDETPDTPEQVWKIIRRAKAEGFVDALGFVHPDVRSLAVPVRGIDEEAFAAVSAVVPLDAPVRNILIALRAAASEIAAAVVAANLPPDDSRAAPGGRYRMLVRSSDTAMRFLASPRSRPSRLAGRRE